MVVFLPMFCLALAISLIAYAEAWHATMWGWPRPVSQLR